MNVLADLWAIKCQNMQMYNAAVLIILDISLLVRYQPQSPVRPCDIKAHHKIQYRAYKITLRRLLKIVFTH